MEALGLVRHIHFAVELPGDLRRLKLPVAVHRRLQSLLDRQDSGERLSAQERAEADGLVNLAELLSLLRLRAANGDGRPGPRRR